MKRKDRFHGNGRPVSRGRGRRTRGRNFSNLGKLTGFQIPNRVRNDRRVDIREEEIVIDERPRARRVDRKTSKELRFPWAVPASHVEKFNQHRKEFHPGINLKLGGPVTFTSCYNLDMVMFEEIAKTKEELKGNPLFIGACTRMMNRGVSFIPKFRYENDRNIRHVVQNLRSIPRFARNEAKVVDSPNDQLDKDLNNGQWIIGDLEDFSRQNGFSASVMFDELAYYSPSQIVAIIQKTGGGKLFAYAVDYEKIESTEIIVEQVGSKYVQIKLDGTVVRRRVPRSSYFDQGFADVDEGELYWSARPFGLGYFFEFVFHPRKPEPDEEDETDEEDKWNGNGVYSYVLENALRSMTVGGRKDNNIRRVAYNAVEKSYRFNHIVGATGHEFTYVVSEEHMNVARSKAIGRPFDKDTKPMVRRSITNSLKLTNSVAVAEVLVEALERFNAEVARGLLPRYTEKRKAHVEVSNEFYRNEHNSGRTMESLVDEKLNVEKVSCLKLLVIMMFILLAVVLVVTQLSGRIFSGLEYSFRQGGASHFVVPLSEIEETWPGDYQSDQHGCSEYDAGGSAIIVGAVRFAQAWLWYPLVALVALLIVRYRHPLGAIGVIGFLLFAILPGVVSNSGGEVAGNYDYTITTLVGVIIAYNFFLVAKNTYLDYQESRREKRWAQLKKVYVKDKRLISYVGPCYTPCFQDIESDLDLSNFPMDPDARITFEDVPDKQPRDSFRVVGIVTDGVFPSQFSTSQNNLLKSLFSRVLLAVGKADDKYWQQTDCYTVHLDLRGSKYYHLEYYCKEDRQWKGITTTFEEWADRFPPGKRNRCYSVREKLEEGYYNGANFHFETFVKRELAMDVTHDEYVEGRPRAIQGSSWPLKVSTGPWVYSFGYALKMIWNKHNDIFYASGCSTDDLNGWFMDSCSCYRIPLFVATDFSKYDVTQGAEAMSREVERFRILQPFNWIEPDYVKFWFQCKRYTRGYSNLSVQYEIPDKRKSGENETSCGNTVNTADCFVRHAKRFGYSYRIAVLGDDNFAILDGQEIIKIWGEYDNYSKSFQEHCTKLGYKVKIAVTTNAAKAEFLSLRFYKVNGMFRVGKKPGRNLVKIGFMKMNNQFKEEDYLRIWYAKLISYLPTSNHVPFLRVYINECIKYCRNKNIRADFGKLAIKNPYAIRRGQIFRPADDTFADFEDAYGLSRTDEKRYREVLSTHIREHGLVSCMHNPYIIRLWKADLDG